MSHKRSPSLGATDDKSPQSPGGAARAVGARAELQAVAPEIVERVRVLDGLVAYRFGDNTELMGPSASVRNPSLRSGQVVLGPFKPKNEPGAGGSQTPKAA